MRSFFRVVLMALILVAVGVMSALTAMRVAIHGRETTVPSFLKLSPSEAERLAVTNGLLVVLEGQFYSSEIPEGKITSQMPPAGTRVKKGWRVRLAQSLGPQRVSIPDVTGQSPRAAELNVRQRGLQLGTVAEVSLPDSPTQQVLAQSPPAAATNIESPKISVLVAAEPNPQAFVMPNFVGHTLREASVQIADAGMKLKPTAASEGALIVRQHPAAGQKISSGTVITLETATSLPAAPSGK